MNHLPLSYDIMYPCLRVILTRKLQLFNYHRLSTFDVKQVQQHTINIIALNYTKSLLSLKASSSGTENINCYCKPRAQPTTLWKINHNWFHGCSRSKTARWHSVQRNWLVLLGQQLRLDDTTVPWSSRRNATTSAIASASPEQG